ncbi:MAG: phosphoribosylformylglycinamidine cyclo-ligase [Parasphingorhabdus sp.]
MVEKSKIIDGTKVAPGNVLIGLPASGPHSNGYSLIRKIIEVSRADLQQDIGGVSLGEALMEPTRIYVKALLTLFKQVDVKALSHITGGGLLENIPRVLPANSVAVIETQSWQQPAVFKWLQSQGNVTDTEMYRTFNCGVGMVIVVTEEDQAQALSTLAEAGESPWVIGHIQQNDGSQDAVLMR